jgi:hypothetical protein
MRVAILVLALFAVAQCDTPRMMMLNLNLGSVPQKLINCAGDGAPYTTIQFDDNVTLLSPPKKGANIGIEATGTALTDATIDHVQLTALSKNADGSFTSLQVIPIKSGQVLAAGGPFDWKFGYYAPGFIPTGDYKIQFEFVAPDATTLDCNYVLIRFE